jgi:hypothetical protein
MDKQGSWQQIEVVVPTNPSLSPEQWAALLAAITAAVPAVIQLVMAIIALFTKPAAKAGAVLLLAAAIGLVMGSHAAAAGTPAPDSFGAAVIRCPAGGCVWVTADVPAIVAASPAGLVVERVELFRGRRPLQRIVAWWWARHGR